MNDRLMNCLCGKRCPVVSVDMTYSSWGCREYRLLTSCGFTIQFDTLSQCLWLEGMDIHDYWIITRAEYDRKMAVVAIRWLYHGEGRDFL